MRGAAASASTPATPRLHAPTDAGNPGVRIMPTRRANSSSRAGSRPHSLNVTGAASAAHPRTRASAAAAITASVPPSAIPTSHTPWVSGRSSRKVTAARMSASQPATEKSPPDAPVPRQLNASAYQPHSRAIRSASSGKVAADAAAPRGPVGNPWQITTAGAGAVPLGLAKCAASVMPSEENVASRPPVSSTP